MMLKVQCVIFSLMYNFILLNADNINEIAPIFQHF